MTPSPNHRPTRLLGLLLAGPLFLALLLFGAWLRFHQVQAGISGFLADAFTLKPIRAFGATYLLRILLPIYVLAGIGTWAATLLPGLLARRSWLRDWKGREAMGFVCSGLLWAHTLLWWRVPSALWVQPGLRNLPFWLIFTLLAGLSLAYPLYWLLTTQRLKAGGSSAMMALWLLSWSLVILIPGWLPGLKPGIRPGNQPCRVLMVGIDGLRSDTFLAEAGALKGVRYHNVYTVIPATRLLWSILWGGDPMTFTIGHVGASMEEFWDVHGLRLLKAAKDQGWKPRFYMDDGGTISLAGRQMDLDDTLMPAAGWENFVNSNLAVSFPLYAVWENWFKPFPTTNPWAPLDAGLKEALRLGRGSGWVMFHSCLAHQPIFLTRPELAQAVAHWWQMRPITLEPKAHVGLVTPADLARATPETSSFHTYEIRMNSILRSWEPIWNTLDQDPSYRGSVRMLFSDHGERYHHVTDDFTLQGVHGYNLDPWECRATLLAAGPGFSDQVQTTPREGTISLLSVVRGMTHLLGGKGPLDAAYLEGAEPVAPMRYHTLATSAFGIEPYKFRAEAEKDLAASTLVGPNGVIITQYSKSATERAKDASVAWAEGPMLHVFHPLVDGGGRESIFNGYLPVSDKGIDEATFQKAKAKVEALLSDPTLRPVPPAPTKP